MKRTEGLERKKDPSIMSLFNASVLLIMLLMYSIATASTDGLNPIIDNSDSSENSAGLTLLSQSQPGLDPVSLNFMSAVLEDLEGSEYCVDLLRTFGQRYVSNVNCLVSHARPVQVCENCFLHYSSLVEIYTNISSDQMGPGNVSCRDSLLRSDRLMLIYLLFDNLEEIWTTSGCDHCVNKGLTQLTNDTFYFMAVLNQSRSCFERYQQSNHSELCKECKAVYKGLNELYGRMEKNFTLCIDIEDAMNMTRRLWSKNFSCSLPREETVPVMAVSSFLLFLPIIFYLSSFLHSEQKKRKLIHPKRAKSSTSLMNIQEKFS